MTGLFRSTRLAVRHRPAGDGSRLVVTFDHLQPDGALDRPGFGESFLAGEGIAAIRVAGAGNDWYEYPEMAEAMAAARAVAAGAGRVMTCGSSMGAMRHCAEWRRRQHWRRWREAIASALARDPNSTHHARSQAYYREQAAARDRRWRHLGGGRVRRQLQRRWWRWRRRWRGEPPADRPPGF